MGAGSRDLRKHVLEVRDGVLKKRGGERPPVTRKVFADSVDCADHYYEALGHLQLADTLLEIDDLDGAETELDLAESHILAGQACEELRSTLSGSS